MSGGIVLAQPWWLLLLPPAVLLALWAERKSRLNSRGRRRLVRLTRVLMLVALILALAEPHAWQRLDRLTVIFAADASRSVGPEGLEHAYATLDEATRHLPEGDRVGVVVFGEQAMVESRPRENWEASELLSRPGGQATDLEAAVRLARGLFPPGHEARLVLLTDGLETRGSIENAVAGGPENIDVVWMPFDSGRSPEVMVESVSAPERVSEGQPHKVRVLIRATEETEAVLRVFQGTSLISASRVHLTPNRGNLFSVEREAPDRSGPLLYTAEVEVAGDDTVENNRAAAVVRVEGRPHVLLIDTDPESIRPLGRALERADVTFITGTPAALPADLMGMTAYDTIVLADAPATDFSPGQLVALGSYVDAAGGGLVMIGGPDSFGPGGYWKSPVEKALPVDMDVEDRRHYPSSGLVLCIDKSGSMAGARTAQKIDVAKAAAAEVAMQLTALDRVGVIGFDAAAKWVVPMSPGGEAESVISKLATLRAGGGTDAYPAMELALEALDGMNVRVKHVILLTDGQLAARDHEGLASRMAGAGISVSTVAVGPDADLYTLERIAKLGGGEFYLAADIQRVPRIFLREAFKISRAWLVEEPFQPVPRMDHAVLAGLDLSAVPPLEGYVATTAKPGAQHLLSTPKGDPLLSIWRYGLGKAAAFTSDAKGRWADSWVRWPGYSAFWSQILRWASRDDTDGRLHVVSQATDGSLRVGADFLGPDGLMINGARLRAIVAAPDGSREERSLQQVGPGRYETTFDVRDPGVYLAAVVDENEKIGATSTAVLPYSSEFNSLDRSPYALERLMVAGKVRSIDQVEQLFEHTGAGGSIRHSLVPLLLAVAATMLVVEVAARKLSIRGPPTARREAASSQAMARLRGARERARERRVHETDEHRVPAVDLPIVADAPSRVHRRISPAARTEEGEKEESHTFRLLKIKRRGRGA